MKESPTTYYIDYDIEDSQVLASNQPVTVKVQDKEVETSLGSIIGTMVAFGLAVHVANKKNEKLKEEENKNQK